MILEKRDTDCVHLGVRFFSLLYSHDTNPSLESFWLHVCIHFLNMSFLSIVHDRNNIFYFSYNEMIR